MKRASRIASLGALLFVLAAGGVARAQPAPAVASEPPRDTTDTNLRYPPSGARYGVVIAGSIITAVAYGGSAAMGAGWSDVPGADMLYVPVAGPWIALGESGCAPTEESSPGEGDCEPIMALRGILFVLDGLLQAGGLVILGEGIFMTTEADSPTPAPAKASITPSPFVLRDAIGIGLVGTF